MKGQHVFIWTGGQPRGSEGCRQMADALPLLPAPAPLRQAAHIEYRWGETKFEVLSTACSVRTTAWGRRQMTWLHCKAMRTAEIKPDEPTGLINVLIPAHYVTGIKPGPTFRLGRSQMSSDLAIFPPNRPTPVEGLPLAEVERVLAELLAPERN